MYRHNYFNRSWFLNPNVISFYSSIRQRELFTVNYMSGGVHELAYFLNYPYEHSCNLLPVNAYASISIRTCNISSIYHIREVLSKASVTAAFLPTISALDPFDFLPCDLLSCYVKRNDSFSLDLTLSEHSLLKNISNRNRSAIKKSSDSVSFFSSDASEIDIFITLYLHFVSRLQTSPQAIYSREELRTLAKTCPVTITGLKVGGHIEIMHLIGLNHHNSAEFFLAAATTKGRSLGTQLIWLDALHLKSLSYSKFHLGGGIRPGDGVEQFKSRMGGSRIYNGGLKLILDPKSYSLNLDTCSAASSFFPPYLAQQINGL